VLFLLTLAFALCGWVAVRSVSILEALRAGGNPSEVPRVFGYSLVDLPFLDTLRARPGWFALAAFVAAAVATLPAVLSVCAKLGENVAERITPLMSAFERVAQGDRSVHLEEAGSDQFLSLAVSFNDMVDKLYLAQRIERAFGQYVSKEVLDRIRAQPGGVRLQAELRTASVFFADIRGFTPISERLPPELVVDLLNRYFDQVVPVVERYQGFLNKFIGDAVVVVFNGPIEQPDHAERATGCAIALQELMSKLNSRNFFAEVGELQIGIGVASGPMLCGNVGTKSRLEYTVIGDTVNLASRMTGHARGGEVWVSEATALGLPTTYPAAPSAPIKFKGKDNAIVPYCVWPATTAGATEARGRS
jgi:adenylate cyclase